MPAFAGAISEASSEPGALLEGGAQDNVGVSGGCGERGGGGVTVAGQRTTWSAPRAVRAGGRETLSQLISRLLTAHPAAHGIDLHATHNIQARPPAQH